MCDKEPIVEMSIAPLTKDSYRLIREQVLNRLIRWCLDSEDYWIYIKNIIKDNKLAAELLYAELTDIPIYTTVLAGGKTRNKYVDFYLLNPEDKKYITEDILQDIKRSWAEKDRGSPL